MTQAEWDKLVTALGCFDADVALKAVHTLAERSEESDIPRLRELVINGKDFYLREAAAAPLARLEGIRCLPLLFEAKLKGEAEGHDNDGLCFVITELFEAHPAEIAPMLLEMVARTSSESRKNAAWGLGWVSPEIAMQPLLKALADESPDVRAAAAGSLGHPRYNTYPEV